MRRDDKRNATGATCAAFLAAVTLLWFVGHIANGAAGIYEVVLRSIQWGFVPLFFGGIMILAWKHVPRDR